MSMTVKQLREALTGHADDALVLVRINSPMTTLSECDSVALAWPGTCITIQFHGRPQTYIAHEMGHLDYDEDTGDTFDYSDDPACLVLVPSQHAPGPITITGWYDPNS